MMKTRIRILTGDRPTGRLHLGHYAGSLANRIRLQRDGECFLVVADLHALTTRPERHAIALMRESIRQMVLDYLAVGIDPIVCTIFLQSEVPQTFELNVYLQMLTKVARLARVPSLREMARAARQGSLTLGQLGYPVLQAADILLPRATLVPVGKDNAAHVEVARELARRFNHLYGDVFPVPEVLQGRVSNLLGTDGQAKMSKSLDNAIYLSDAPEVVSRKVMKMYTDPRRLRPDIPGRVDGNPVFQYHDAFNPDRAEVDELKNRYRQGRVGDVEVKHRLIACLEALLVPIRQRREQLESEPGLVEDILCAGTRRARKEAGETMELVRQAMGMYRLAAASMGASAGV
jgi:tryptophanyl-tRNA synthetase